MDDSILLEIEKCRQKMILSSEKNTFTSEEVIKISQKLDDLLNKHQACINNFPVDK
ncbi:MAG TPA: aspartyl-phosphate phosphatase Spo0E family protein [Bacillota bacterium]|nr:aspartyl-phosphate phosphatase Spo0E family protein [Bacillota bacterium]